MEGILQYLEYVWSQLKGARFIDFIDILIVAFFVYWVFKFVRDRRAGKLLVGVVFLAVILLISDLLQMRALNFILNAVFSVGIVAIVIVFQPELRTALEKVGGESLRNFKGKLDGDTESELRSAVREISSAAASLSQSKTGALIVFERSTRLGDYIRTGTVVDAVVSSSLLGNIFFNKAPLHDGAVIIRNARVHSAGCFLPLSSNSEIIKDLGTRHRAAIGMSENSDAIVLVVSEENGVISVAKEGKLRRHLNQNSLENFLLKELIPEDNKKHKNIKKLFKKDGEGDGDGTK